MNLVQAIVDELQNEMSDGISESLFEAASELYESVEHRSLEKEIEKVSGGEIVRDEGRIFLMLQEVMECDSDDSYVD